MTENSERKLIDLDTLALYDKNLKDFIQKSQNEMILQLISALKSRKSQKSHSENYK